MKEIADILQAFERAAAAGKKTALATVVHVEGSSYRRPGARMLVTEDGELTGAISGGCLEGDALRKALLAIHQQQNKLVTYDTSDEEDHTIGIQLGCNGIVYILFEPIFPGATYHPLQLLGMAVQHPGAVLITLFNLHNSVAPQPGTCRLITNTEDFCSANHTPPKQVFEAAIQQVRSTRQSTIEQYHDAGNALTAFIELIPPPVHLTIAGAGNDVYPVVQLASMLGWHVTIVDGRATHANAQRFPTARRIIVARPAEAVEALQPQEKKILLLMSHNYNYDAGLLAALVHEPVAYIGVLGPRKKLQKMLDTLSQQGLMPSKEWLQQLYGPVGLDLGAETAEEIALSIVAEIKAVLSSASAHSLRHKQGMIHQHPVLSTS